jgi:hypothetical protein
MLIIYTIATFFEKGRFQGAGISGNALARSASDKSYIKVFLFQA